MARNTPSTSEAGDEDITDSGGTTGVAPTPAAMQQPSESSSSHVQYQGRATHRRVTREQFTAAGVEGQGSVEFNALNNYRLPAADFTGPALEELRADGSFLVPNR